MNNTIGLLLVVRNEIKRIKACLDHHVPYVNQVSIVDQSSDDGTWELLLKYKRKSDVPMVVMRDKAHGYPEPSKQTALNNLTTEWVLYVDPDEKFPEEFLQEMRKIVAGNQQYDGFQFPRQTTFEVDVYGEGVPIEPKVLSVTHPALDPQIRLTRRSLTVYPQQLHMRGRITRPDGKEYYRRLDHIIEHTKTIKEQWDDNNRYDGAYSYIVQRERPEKYIHQFTYNDIKFQLDMENKHVEHGMREKGELFYEQPMLEWIHKNLGEGGTYIDVGGYVGSHSLFFEKICKADKVYTFEPVPEHLRRLYNNLFLNDSENIFVYPCAVGNTWDTMGYDLDLERTNPCAVPMVEGKGIPVVMLDDILFDSLDELKVLKIDVEGMELEVLEGAENILRTFRPHCFVEAGSDDDRNFLDIFFRNFGYTRKEKFNATPTHHYVP